MKYLKYLIALVMVCLFIIPPLLSGNTIQFRSDIWAWFVLLMGAVAFSSLYLKVNLWIKLLTIWLYINCFLSQMPVTSLVSYASYLGALIIYVFCLRLTKDEFKFVLKIFPVLFLLEALVLTLQLTDKSLIAKALDLGKDVNYGTVSNSMMFGSMICVMSFPLILNKKWYVIPIIVISFCFPQLHRSFPPFLIGCAFYTYFKIKTKKWKLIFVAIFLIASVFLIKEKVSELSMRGHRGPIWVRLVQMSNDRPIKGWGLGTLKYLLPLNTEDIADLGIDERPEARWRIGQHEGKGIMWNRAHNDYLHFLFEVGRIGLLLLLGLIGWIIWRFCLAIKTEHLILTMAGLIAIGLNMIETFPSTMIQLVPITIFLLAYFTKLTEVPDERI